MGAPSGPVAAVAGRLPGLSRGPERAAQPEQAPSRGEGPAVGPPPTAREEAEDRQPIGQPGAGPLEESLEGALDLAPSVLEVSRLRETASAREKQTRGHLSRLGHDLQGDAVRRERDEAQQRRQAPNATALSRANCVGRSRRSLPRPPLSARGVNGRCEERAGETVRASLQPQLAAVGGQSHERDSAVGAVTRRVGRKGRPMGVAAQHRHPAP